MHSKANEGSSSLPVTGTGPSNEPSKFIFIILDFFFLQLRPPPQKISCTSKHTKLDSACDFRVKWKALNWVHPTPPTSTPLPDSSPTSPTTPSAQLSLTSGRWPSSVSRQLGLALSLSASLNVFFPLDLVQPSYTWLSFPGSLDDRNWPCPAKLSATYLPYLFLYSSLPKLANLFLQMATHLGKGRARETDLLGTSLSARPSLPFSVSPRSVQFQSLMPNAILRAPQKSGWSLSSFHHCSW